MTPEVSTAERERIRTADQVMSAVFAIGREVLAEQAVIMDKGVEDTHIISSEPILTPLELKTEIPRSAKSERVVLTARREIADTIANPTKDSKLIVFSGPCSIHDYAGALRYARSLKELSEEHEEEIITVMRLMVDKPRTPQEKGGQWEGFIEDPDLDKTYDKRKGLLLARQLCSEITEMGLPVGLELLNDYTPQAIGDFASFYTIGARTVQSQPHQKLAALVSAPVAMKNNTAGNVHVAIQAALSARHPHMVDACNKFGQLERYKTKGNPSTIVMLRGGNGHSNYSAKDVAAVKAMYAAFPELGMPAIGIDFAHENSLNEKGNKDHNMQEVACLNTAEQIAGGDSNIIIVTFEANIKAGSQPHIPGELHDPDKSITDPGVDIEQAKKFYSRLAGAVITRRFS